MFFPFLSYYVIISSLRTYPGSFWTFEHAFELQIDYQM